MIMQANVICNLLKEKLKKKKTGGSLEDPGLNKFKKMPINTTQETLSTVSGIF